jgi:hypothetical protein
LEPRDKGRLWAAERSGGRNVSDDEQKSLRCMRSYGCVRVSLPLRPCDRVGHAATFPVFGGWF